MALTLPVRATSVGLGLLAAGVLTTACSPAGTDRPAPTDQPGTAAVTTGTADTPGSVPGTTAPVGGNGCPPNNGQVPAGAHQVATADLDLDGDPDTLWLADVGGSRILGVRTATGATFSTVFQSAAPQAAAASGYQLTPAGPAIILLNTGRSVPLYTVVNCEITPTLNAEGEQYTFDLGFTGYGTGVVCIPVDGGLTLAGMLASPSSTGNDFEVSRTTITLSDFGRQARNGARQTLSLHEGPDSELVHQARSVTCGTANAVATEPQS